VTVGYALDDAGATRPASHHHAEGGTNACPLLILAEEG